MSNRLSTISPVDFKRSTLPGQVIAGNPLVLLGADFQGGFTATGDITVMGSIDLVGENPIPSFSINGEPIAGGGTGTPAGSNGQIQFNDDGAFGASQNLVWDNANSRLGIGTQEPQHTLSILNFSDVVGILAQARTSNADITIWNGVAVFQGIGGPNGNLQIGITNAGDAWIQSALSGTGGQPTRLALNPLGGNVGVGTQNPQATFDVQGRQSAQTTARITSANGSIGPSLGVNDPTFLSIKSGDDVSEITFGFSMNGPAFPAYIQARSTGGAYPLVLNPLGGPVGINTQNPQAKLTVRSDYSDPSIPLTSSPHLILSVGFDDPVLAAGVTASGSPFATWLQTFNRPLSINPLGGNVGVNTLNPQAALDIKGGIRFDYNPDNQFATMNMAGSLLITADQIICYSAVYFRGAANVQAQSEIAFGVNNGADIRFVVVDTVNSRVGIGDGISNVDPFYTLDVRGDIRASGNIYVDNRVGIGTLSPQTALDVRGAIRSLWQNGYGIGLTIYTEFLGSGFNSAASYILSYDSDASQALPLLIESGALLLNWNSGGRIMMNLSSYQDNDEAVSAGLRIGQLYKDGVGSVKIVI